jgi:hypothetical protein
LVNHEDGHFGAVQVNGLGKVHAMAALGTMLIATS